MLKISIFATKSIEKNRYNKFQYEQFFGQIFYFLKSILAETEEEEKSGFFRRHIHLLEIKMFIIESLIQ
jgi:hypothetical protein